METIKEICARIQAEKAEEKEKTEQRFACVLPYFAQLEKEIKEFSPLFWVKIIYADPQVYFRYGRIGEEASINYVYFDFNGNLGSSNMTYGKLGDESIQKAKEEIARDLVDELSEKR